MTTAVSGGSRRESRDLADLDVIDRQGFMTTLKRTAREFSQDNCTDWAAALTYYAVMSMFPALIALVGIVGLVMDPSDITKTIGDTLRQIAPGSDTKQLQDTIANIGKDKGTGTIMLIVGILGALWSASGYVGAFSRASNALYETAEGRGFFKLRPLQLLVTLVMILLAALMLVALVISGPITDALFSALGIGDFGKTVFTVVKWPLMAVVVLLMLSILYYFGPNAKLPRFRWITIGSTTTVAVWAVASGAFAAYVSNFGSYNKTYGALGGVITFLVWLWITNIAVLFGQELNAEIERTREIKAGNLAAVDQIQLDPRDEPSAKQLPDTAEGANPPPASKRGPDKGK